MMKKKYNILQLVVIIFSITVILYSSCKKDEVAPSSTVSSVELISGGSQTYQAEKALPNLIIIVVKDQNGTPLKDITVSFSVGEGAVSNETSITDSDGQATVRWTLGSSVGEQILKVVPIRSDGVTPILSTLIKITATATEKIVASTVELVSGDNQTAMAESELTDPIEVIVKDQNGDAIADIDVSFSVVEGSVSESISTTDASGKTNVTWTLGSTEDTQTLTVNVFEEDGTTAITGSPIIVSATATEKLIASSLELVSGNGQYGSVGTSLDDPIEVLVKDQNGVAFEGATVNFSVTEGSVSVSSAITDVNGKATVIRTLGSTIGIQSLTVSAFKTDGVTALSGSPITVNATGTISIGVFYKGGVIVYIDGTGIHGLVCAVSDQNSSLQWYNGSYTTTGATGTAILTGQANTTTIISNQGAGSYAAQVCNDLSSNGYNDWFLPSQDELNQIYLNKTSINSTATANGGSGFANDFYWSSTEYDTNNARGQHFGNASQAFYDKANTYNVRAIRAF